MPKKKSSAKKAKLNPRQSDIVVGKVDYVHPTYAYIIAKEGIPDIWVKHEDLHGALHQDTVKVKILPNNRKAQRLTGQVVDIVARSQAPIVGVLERHGKVAFVIPDGRRMHHDIFIQPKWQRGAKDGDKVVVAITDWPKGQKNPNGIVKKILGQAGKHEVEMHAIVAEYGLATDFPKKAITEVRAIDTAIPSQEITRRKDYRQVPTFTIDPEDAKDFDDALSLKQLPNGHYEVGIHIADVSHYVPEGSHLDKEAFKRGTSVYLVDRTLPMLPEKLSNKLCSLRPQEDKLTFSAIFELDDQGKVHQQWFGEAIIYSDKRFTYEEAQQVIDQQQGDFYQELTILNQLAHKLRQARFQQGALSFETPEVKFQLNAQGKPLQVLPKIRKDTHKLVEEFMLLANQKVATWVAKLQPGHAPPPFVYRTHDSPDPEKLTNFFLFVKQLGYKTTANRSATAQALNAITTAVEGTTEAHIVQSLAIRTMAKALYTTAAKPHFGLAFQHYTHFTSPIRRYPDVMVHRLLKKYLQGHPQPDTRAYEEQCRHASERERVAVTAERASIRYKQVEFMKTLQGKVLEGIIGSILDWGIFIELLENQCEGMVRLAELQDDYYEVDTKRFQVIGRRHRKIYRLGDQVQVKVKTCDLTKRTVELTLVT